MHLATLPPWFLVLAVFLPRVALFLEWLEGFRFPFPLLGDAALFLFLPRVLVLILIYMRLGIGMWFWIHLAAALVVYSGGSHRVVTRNR